MSALSEALLEDALLGWLKDDLGWTVIHGPHIAPGEPAQERDRFDQVVLTGRLRSALERINAKVGPDAIDEAVRRLTVASSPELVRANRDLQR